MRPRASSGFTMIELLMVLAVIGTITAIAIPALSGQRQRAKRIGDAESNARVLGMALETHKADAGSYGPAGATAIYTPSGAVTLSLYTANPAPSFTPQGNSQMSYRVTAQPLTYEIEVFDGEGVGGTKWLALNQNGAKTIFIK